MYRMMDTIKLNRKLNAHNAAIKRRDTANQLQHDILGFIAAITPPITITNIA